MSQISDSQVQAMSARGAVAIRQLLEKNASLETENASLRNRIREFETEKRASAIASEMQKRGLNEHLTFDEKVASILRQSDLDKVQAAVEMSNGGSIKLADVGELPNRGSDSTVDLHSWLTT